MRSQHIIANWKMNKDLKEAEVFALELAEKLKGTGKVRVIIAAPYIHLPFLKDKANKKIGLAAQNLYPGEKGAFTGEISGNMLKPYVSYVILGHSERRSLFGDNDQLVNEKIQSALFFNLRPIICLGETTEQKENGQTKQVLNDQLSVCLKGLKADEVAKCILVYEPIWAISSSPGATGQGDNPENAQVMHKLIRHFIEEKFGKELADKIPIIYGGSVNPQNASDLLAMPDIDGGLVGKASLPVNSFFEIIEIAAKQ
ncbi:MAG: triose-phosphate isomerase [Patescibacteria group bacterium]